MIMIPACFAMRYAYFPAKLYGFHAIYQRISLNYHHVDFERTCLCVVPSTWGERTQILAIENKITQPLGFVLPTQGWLQAVCEFQRDISIVNFLFAPETSTRIALLIESSVHGRRADATNFKPSPYSEISGSKFSWRYLGNQIENHFVKTILEQSMRN